MTYGRLVDFTLEFHSNHLTSTTCPQTQARTEAPSEWREFAFAIARRSYGGHVRATVPLRRGQFRAGFAGR
jgi:hypothetical protein